TGAIISAIALGQFLRNIDRARLLAVSMIAFGITMLGLAAVPQAMAQLPDLHVHARLTGAAFSLLLGIEFGAIMIPAATYLMESTSDEIRGRIFALLYMVTNGRTATRAQDLATPEPHIGPAGKHRSPRPQPEHEARRQDRPITVPGEEHLGARDVLRPDSEEAAEPFHERPPAPEPEVVAEIGARGG